MAAATKPRLTGRVPKLTGPCGNFSFGVRGVLRSGFVQMIEGVVEAYGVDAHDNNFITLLMAAVDSSNVASVTCLLKRGAAVNIREGIRNETALHRASAGADEEVVTLLLRAGADPTIKDNDGLTPRACIGRVTGFTYGFPRRKENE